MALTVPCSTCLRTPYWIASLIACVDQHLAQSGTFLPPEAYESTSAYFFTPEVQTIDLGVLGLEWNNLYATFEYWRSVAARPPAGQAVESLGTESSPAPVTAVAPSIQSTWKWADGKRQGRPRAILIPEGEATTKDTAAFTKLDPAETAKWLNDPTGQPVDPNERIQAGIGYKCLQYVCGWDRQQQ
jgi:hypothetical protein